MWGYYMYPLVAPLFSELGTRMCLTGKRSFVKAEEF